MPVQHWILRTDGKWARGTRTMGARDQLVPGSYRPSASTTGPVNPAALTLHAGNITTPTPGLLFENLDITGRVIVTQGGCVFRNCRIAGGVIPDYSVDNSYGSVRHYNAVSPRTLFVDCEVFTPYADVNASVGIQGQTFILRRCNVHGTVDGVKAQNGNVLVEACWIHDLPHYSYDPRQSDGSHNDGIQCEGGGGGFEFIGNSIEMAVGTTQGMMITQNVGNITGLIIDQNWITSVVGGAYVGVNLSEKSRGAMTGVEITGNRFSPAATWRHGRAGFVDSNTYDVATITGNVWLETGLPATIQRVQV